jgi:hypothetical protein
MKKKWHFISTCVLVVIASLSCAQPSDKKEASLSAKGGPELRWKYETGGLTILDAHGRGRTALHRFLCRHLLRY